MRFLVSNILDSYMPFQMFYAPKVFANAYGCHILSFCEAVIEELRTKYQNDGELNYELGFHHLQTHTNKKFSSSKDGIICSLNLLARKSVYDDGSFPMRHIRNKFRRLLTNEEKTRIFSRAAVYSFVKLCDQSPEARKEANEFLRIGKFNTRIRRSYPWRWHRQVWSRLHVGRIYFMPKFGHRDKYRLWRLSQIKRRRPNRICSIFAPHPLSFSRAPSQYLIFLRAFIKLLPCAGRYPYLIGLCRTRDFSALSMMFPGLSRRARREITKYLARMEIEGNIQKWYADCSNDRN